MASEPVRINRPLIAHWTFDEPSGGECLDSSASGHHAGPERKQAPGFRRTEGVFGGAVEMAGPHNLRVPGKPQFAGLRKVSFCAWVMPTDLAQYREIFRKEDGDRRVLFSFQDNGTHLALGLNVGGYVECDAEIDPVRLLDGTWHHAAATFDGQWMRVYLDGRQIGALERRGAIVAGGNAPGCIGSSNGGECFQGAMDDLRVYSDALTPEEIALVYRSGLQSVQRHAREMDQRVQSVYKRGASFAETLAGLRLSSANSINIGRLLPQSFYYIASYLSVTRAADDPVVFSVPSGNLGNLTAGVIAQRMGLPVRRFIAASNLNDVLPSFLSKGEYRARAAMRTLSNAMDVGDPSNFPRLFALHGGSLTTMRENLAGIVIDDRRTRETIRDVYARTGYLLDPHGAVGYAAAREFAGIERAGAPVVALATAHPAKFGDAIAEELGFSPPLPAGHRDWAERPHVALELPDTEYASFRAYLVSEA